ncbi:hypothetical protein MYX65_01545 [Acidobacteria bacterium AH-259-L09]|nr:hypothetical protein [Acidobacteria bacterium AH-259-L09]
MVSRGWVGSRRTLLPNRQCVGDRRDRNADFGKDGFSSFMIDTNELLAFIEEVEHEHGRFTLFGLFLREGAQDNWDLVLSAPWLERGKLKALGEFVQKFASTLGQDKLLELSRIVTVNQGDPALKAILNETRAVRGVKKLQDSNLFGLPIEQA